MCLISTLVVTSCCWASPTQGQRGHLILLIHSRGSLPLLQSLLLAGRQAALQLGSSPPLLLGFSGFCGQRAFQVRHLGPRVP